MATKTVSSTGLSAAQTAQLQSIVNSNPQYAQSYSTGVSAAAPSIQQPSNPKDAPGYVPGSSATDSAASKAAYALNPNYNAPTQKMEVQTPAQAPTVPETAPNNAQVNAPNTGYDEAMIQKITDMNPELGDQIMNTLGYTTSKSLSDKYRQSLSAVKSTGINAPVSQGTASAAIQTVMPSKSEEKPSIVGDIIETDSNFDSILTMYDQFMSPTSQKQSLLDEYNNLSKSLGIEQMNQELIDAKKIIDGTEDDIRNEVTAAGGFATDSQVLALSNARNKSLIKNYNYLLESRDNARTQLSTMMNLSIEDRKMASAEFDRKLDFAFKVSEFKQKATSNSRAAYQAIVDRQGYAGLLAATNGNTYEQGIIEKTMGWTKGSLSRLAALPDYDLEYKKSQIAKNWADANGTGGAGVDSANIVAYAQQYASTGQIPTGLPKGTFGLVSQVAKELPHTSGEIVENSTGIKPGKLTAVQLDAYSALRDLTLKLDEADKLYSKLWTGLVPGITKTVFYTKDQQRYDNLKGEIVDLLARARSGAALTTDEVKNYESKLPGRFNKTLGLGGSGTLAIQDLRKSISDKLDTGLKAQGASMYGFSKVKIGNQEYTVGDIITNGNQSGRVNPDGSITIIQ